MSVNQIMVNEKKYLDIKELLAPYSSLEHRLKSSQTANYSCTSWLPGFARVPSLLPSSPAYLSSSLRASLPPPFFTLHPFLPLPHPYSLIYLLPPSSLLPPFQLPYSYPSPPLCFPSFLPPPFLLSPPTFLPSGLETN